MKTDLDFMNERQEWGNEKYSLQNISIYLNEVWRDNTATND